MSEKITNSGCAKATEKTASYFDGDTAIAELHRADKALIHLNHAEPQYEEWSRAFRELFDGEVPEGLGVFTPTQIDFPKQITFGNHVFINHNFTAMSIGGIEFGDNVQIGPHVTIVTDNHDLTNRNVLTCSKVVIGNNVWIGAGSSLHAMQNDRQHFSLLISDMRKTSLILVICHLLWPKYTDILRMCKYNGITTDLLG